MSNVSIQGKLTISQAASIFGVNKKTLMRWNDSGQLKAYREPLTNSRYYLNDEIEWQAFWYRLRVRHKNHNRRLTSIRAEADKFLATTPLSEYQNPIVIDSEKMKSAYDALRKWENQHRAILAEYSKLPKNFEPTVDSP